MTRRTLAGPSHATLEHAAFDTISATVGDTPNSLLYLGDWESATLRALDPASGETVWKTEGVKLGPDAGPAVAGCTVFAATRKGKLRAFDAATGDEQWSTVLGNKVQGAPAVANGVVYVGDTGGQVPASSSEACCFLRSLTSAPPAGSSTQSTLVTVTGCGPRTSRAR